MRLLHHDLFITEPATAAVLALPPIEIIAHVIDRALRGRRAAADLPIATATTAIAEDPDLDGPVRNGPIVGRDQALAQLAIELEDAPVAAIVGLAGVGKTALARELARTWDGPTIYHSAAAAAPVLGCSSLFGAACSDSVLESSWTRLDRTGGLLVLDDLHALDRRDRRRILDSAARGLTSGRLVVVARECLATAANADHVQLRLHGIDRASAELLWKHLDELREAPLAFEPAWRHARGNPLALRDAHAGKPRDHHPVVHAIRRLDDDERQIIETVAASAAPLPETELAALSLTGDLDALLAGLATRLLLDVTRRSRYSVTPFVRELVIERATARAGSTAQRRGSSAPPAAPAPAPDLRQPPVGAALPLVINGAQHELREGALRIPLRARFMLRRLLYEFAAAPGRRLTRDTIARTLWSVDYDPRRHESSLKSNIRRLRKLLAGTTAIIETVENGYRLCLPPNALFVPPDD